MVSPALANDCKDLQAKCASTVEACDKALRAKRDALELSDLALRKCGESSAVLEKRAKEAEDDANAWYRNPAFLVPISLLAGAVGGLVFYNQVKR